MSDDAPEAPENSVEHDEQTTLGSRLRNARQARDLSIEKIADELRIEEHLLVALEEDRLADINVAPVFIKGYIKQYGRLLQLDYDELRRAFYEQIDAEDIRLRPNKSIQLRDERQITIWIVAALAVLLVAVALLVWWLGSDDVQLPVTFGQSDERTELSTAARADARQAPATVLQEEAAIAGNATAQPQSPALTDSESVAPAPAQVGSVNDPESSAADGAAIASAAVAQAQSSAPVVPQAPEPGAIATEFIFSGESWFELEDAHGQRLYYDLAPAGARLSFTPLPPLRVLIGDADVVSVSVDAQPYSIPASSLRGNVASFVIDSPQD
jgi:cytoskeleton protein RodZ